MKTIKLILCIACFTIASNNSYSQSFLKKIEKGLDKVNNELDKANKALNPEKEKTAEPQKTEPQKANTVEPQKEVQKEAVKPVVKETRAEISLNETVKIKTDWEKQNLKGKIQTIVEKDKWGKDIYTKTMEYNGYGMLVSSNNRGDRVICTYEGNVLVKRQIIPAKEEDGVMFEDEYYQKATTQTFKYNGQGLLSEMLAENYKTVYTHNSKNQLIKSLKTANNKTENYSPYLYVYNDKEFLTAIHMGEISEYPWQAFKYDTKGRIVFHQDASGMHYAYKLNENGDIIEKEATQTFGEEDDSIERYSYEYDASKNWIKRTVKNQQGRVIYTTERTITYFE